MLICKICNCDCSNRHQRKNRAVWVPSEDIEFLWQQAVTKRYHSIFDPPHNGPPRRPNIIKYVVPYTKINISYCMVPFVIVMVPLHRWIIAYSIFFIYMYIREKEGSYYACT